MNAKHYYFALLFYISGLHSANYYETFLQGNESYKKNNFPEALKPYESIPNPSAHVNYNLGNTHYKLENYGKALLHWRRAEKNWGIFQKKELLGNIELLKNKLFPDKKRTWKDSKPFVYAWSNLRSISLRNLQIFFLCFWLFFGIIVRMYRWRLRRFILTILTLLLIITGSMVALKFLITERYRLGIVTSKTASIYSGPSTTYTQLGTIKEAQEVLIEKESENFFKIYDQGKTSWVEKNNLSEV